MGRRKSDIWIHFKEVTETGVTRGKCNSCGTTFAANPDRKKKHRDSCISSSSRDDESEVLRKTLIQSTLTMSSSEKDHEIEPQIPRYFLKSNSDSLQVENKDFEKQDGNVPSRRHILGSKIFKEQLLEKFGKKNFFSKKKF